MYEERKIEIWGGIEGTINRVGNKYLDQSVYSGHYDREGDVDLIASLGISRLRYPVLWEKHEPQKEGAIDWSHAAKNLDRLRALRVEPIAGLVHHGSGPVFVDFFDGSFEQGLAAYARRVAGRFPWLEYYTPVNEPLTTVRFCGLYGHWYPHRTDNLSFYKILLSECKATVMAMKAIREINPHAKLIQTEDLLKTYSTPLLQYQAALENQRRWLSYDLLCGRVDGQHPLWRYLTRHVGLTTRELCYFTENPCLPHICGFNYYVTSERFLDEDLSKYPEPFHGGNETHRYADVEKVRVPAVANSGAYVLLQEAYEQVRLPIAVTECHLHCTREEQMRWFNDMWHTVNRLHTEGIDIRALTAWSVLGAYGWDRLVTKPHGNYEPGVFDLRKGQPRATALTRLIRELIHYNVYHHPVLEKEGWWNRETRVLYPATAADSNNGPLHNPGCQPLLVIEDAGSLSTALDHICVERNIHHILVKKLDPGTTCRHTIEEMIREHNPWAVVHTGEYGNKTATVYASSLMLAEICRKHQVKLALFFSTPSYWLQPDGGGQATEEETGGCCNGQSDQMQKKILEVNAEALLVCTGNLFSPWDNINFITAALSHLKEGKRIRASRYVCTSITYLPDLIRETLDLLLDDERGVVYLTNEGRMTWADIAHYIAELAGFNPSLINNKPAGHTRLPSAGGHTNGLQRERITLPGWQDAMRRYFDTTWNPYQAKAIAV